MFTIGLDLGTTSVKICLVKNGSIVSESQRAHNANVEGLAGVQNAIQILDTACGLIKEISTDVSAPIDSIRIAGQMHGIVFWNGEKMNDGVLECSHLYTWMYTNKEGLVESLRKKNPSLDIQPGYGAVTMFELAPILNQGSNSKYDRCGTIMDLLACYLTGRKEVQISRHLAVSWGYCNGTEWHKDLLEAAGDTICLPSIVEDDSELGTVLLARFSASQVEGARITVPLGDLQASVRSVEERNSENTAYVVMGTSAQLCFVFDKQQSEEHSDIIKDHPSVRRLPYSRDRHLHAVCAMNGGNAVDAFLELVQKWFAEACGGDELLPRMMVENLLEKVDLLEESDVPTLSVVPIFSPERGLDWTGADIKGLTRNSSLVEVLSEICRGVVRNLFSLCPPQILCSLGISSLVLVGGARRPRFARQIRTVCQEYGIRVEMATNDTSAAYGAAIW